MTILHSVPPSMYPCGASDRTARKKSAQQYGPFVRTSS